jgi:hypothetical protein
MRGGNRGALGCCSPETSAMLSAPRAPPEWQASLRERERPENQSHFGRKTHVYLPDYRHCGFIGSSLARAVLQRGDRVRVIGNFSTGKPENIDEINFVWTQLVKNRLKGGARSFDE